MELPKNITQIGETNPHCKVYVEDYVISYIKQLNQYAGEKELPVALYGTRKEEDGITYLFLYGACRLVFLQKECRHLSQAVQQEAEKQRRKYFSDFIFLGYRLLNGEMVEGFHICEQGVCRYVEGYACFYEKNDAMLAFMLEERREEIKPEEFDQEKYNVVKRRQEERRASAEEKGGQAVIQKMKFRKGAEAGPEKGDTKLRNMKWTAAAAFTLLCAAGIASMGSGEKLGEWQTAARQLMENMSEKQLPDAVEVVNNSAQVGTIVAEDRLNDAILKENAGTGMSEEGKEPASDQESAAVEASLESAVSSAPESTAQPTMEPTPEPTAEPTPEPTAEPTPEPTAEPTPEPTPEPTAEPASASAAELVAYTVQRGDTLIGICLKKYGSDTRVAEICAINNISDPDDIKIGEKIFIPQ